MKLWLLYREGQTGYDEYSAFVIRAPSEDSARVIAAERAGPREEGIWTDTRHAACEELSAEGDYGVVLADFNTAG